MAKDDIGGVWRTVGGRRIFIKDGEDLETAMKNSGKFGNNEKDIIVYRGHEAENEYGQYESGTFFAVSENDASDFGKVEKFIIDKKAKIYEGINTQEFCKENNLMNKEYKEIEKYTGLKTLKEVETAMYYQNGESKVDKNPNLGLIAFQTVAKIELENQKYDGAYWKREDELTPRQYQIWNKKIIKK